MSGNSFAAGFPTTCWGQILKAGDPASSEARAALEELCRDYWYPLYGFIRRKGYDPETAQDVVQGLFADLLERGGVSRAGAGAGAIPVVSDGLLRALSGEDSWPGAGRQTGRRAIARGVRRDGRESRFGVEPAHHLTAERLFDRRWALTLLDRIVAGLDAEMNVPEKRVLYERLRPGLLGEEEAPSYKAIALDLGLSEGSVKMAAHRLRGRYRERLREEIARTVADPTEIDDEIRTLLEALAI